LVKSILPRAKTIMPPAKGIRRFVNAGIANAPAKTVHNDYGLIFDEVVDRNPFFDFDKQNAIYEETKSDEYMLINLWRPIKPMSQPLRSLPLCFLNSSTLSKDDFVTIDSKSLGITVGSQGQPQAQVLLLSGNDRRRGGGIQAAPQVPQRNQRQNARLSHRLSRSGRG